MPGEEKPLIASLVSSAPEEYIVPFEEPDIVEFPLPPPKAAKEKGRANNTTTQVSSQVVTLSASKTPVQPPTFLRSPSSTLSVAPSAAPSGIPSAFRPQTIATPSHSGIFFLSLPCKKAAFLDTSATSPDSPTTLALIENVDMVQHMLDSELAGGPLPAYTRIQEFIAKVCIFPFVKFSGIFPFGLFIFFLALVFS